MDSAATIKSSACPTSAGRPARSTPATSLHASSSVASSAAKSAIGSSSPSARFARLISLARCTSARIAFFISADVVGLAPKFTTDTSPLCRLTSVIIRSACGSSLNSGVESHFWAFTRNANDISSMSPRRIFVASRCTSGSMRSSCAVTFKPRASTPSCSVPDFVRANGIPSWLINSIRSGFSCNVLSNARLSSCSIHPPSAGPPYMS